MIRYFFLVLFFVSTLFSLDLSKLETPIHKEIDILKDFDGSLEDILQKNIEFETKKYFRRHLIRKMNNNNLWLRLEINHKNKAYIKRQLVTKWERASIELFLVKDKKIIHSELLEKGKYLQFSSELKLQASQNYTMYLNIKTKKAHDELQYIYFVAPAKVIDFMIYKSKFYDHGLFFGIILTMMMYSFFMYFSIKIKSYLYLGIHQLSVFIYISDLRDYIFFILQDFTTFSYFLAKIFLEFLIILSSVMFTKEFLNTKEKMPIFNKILNISIVLLAISTANDDTIEFGSSILLIFIVAGIYCYLKGNKSAIFYVLGFSTYAFLMFFNNISKLLDMDIYFEYQSLLQVSTSIESFALTMALYLKLKVLMEEKKKTEEMLQIQSKFATMGEMLASIAHQWRQPLNHLSLIFANLQVLSRYGKLDNIRLDKKVEEANLQLRYMSDTVEDFSSFFSKKGKKEKFRLEEVCNSSLDLVMSRCKKANVELTLKNEDKTIYENYKNELMQVLIIILNNAIDALMLNNIDDRNIIITIKKGSIMIEDNAGGIPLNIYPNIFDPYFTTKDKKFGTGLGLYTAKMLIENLLKGKITVSNSQNGAIFSIFI